MAHDDDLHDHRDDRLTWEEQARVNALSPSEVLAIDAAALAMATDRFQKVFSVVGRLLLAFGEARPARLVVPSGYFVRRIAHLVERGELRARGDVRRMGHGEIRRAPFQLPRFLS